MSKGGSSGNQTVTQQNIPDWALDYAQNTLDMGRYYTNNQNYRPSTLDRDYSGIRGYNAEGQPNSQVGQSGLNPNGGEIFGGGPGSSPGVGIADRVGAEIIENDAQRQALQALKNRNRTNTPSSPQGFRGGANTEPRRPDGSIDYSQYGRGLKFADEMPATSGRSTFKSYEGAPKGGVSNSGGLNTINSQSESTGGNEGYLLSHKSESTGGNEGYTIQTNTSTGTTTTAEETSTVDPRDIFNPDNLTPFQAYDRQRFAAPGQNTLRGEGILAGRYDQRFGEGGTDPFAAANQAVGSAANYTSGFQGTTGEGQIGGQAGNYQANLANASNPGVFQSRDYTTGLPNFENTVNLNAGDFQNVVNPMATSYGNTNQGMTGTEFGNVNQAVTGRSYGNANANQANVNANLTNPLQGLEPVTFESANQGLTSSTYGNANQGLQGPQDYNRGFQGLLNQSFNPFQDQVVNQTIQDLDRARRISENDIRGQAAKAGAFGSREELLRAENNRNYLDRVAAATGQLRSQGFESAANRASQENLQRLGLTASDIQNVRGLQSQGNLQGQSLSAAADQQLRGLQSQGNLQAQNLTASDRASARDLAGRGALQTQALQSQGGLQAQNLRAQGAQAAQGLTAQSDRQTQGLQSQGALAGQQLTAQDAQQVRSLISQGGLQGQNLTAADRQQLNDLVSRGALQSQNLSAADRQQLNSLITQGALQSQNLNANLLNQALGLNAGMDRAALQANAGLLSDAMGLDAADLQQRRNLASAEAQFAETANRGAGALNLQGGQALGQLAQAGTADERQRIADILAAGGAGDARNQQDLDFIFNEFNRELAYPGQQIDLRNAAISPATGSIVTTTQPRYQQNPILGGAGAGLAAYGMTGNPYIAGGAALLSLLG